ncbi:hypothetical protein PoB_005815200 [Plakobranchus ocellatus]|uniref:Uncharacterized protein n=1 Tax=Plakobranchus ocellatus TaxID=259542 RepID=A0AAV4CJ02_9GAST|nr:hypothetical protein PoB_005815200 [Plakobranchus ocellatus]
MRDSGESSGAQLRQPPSDRRKETKTQRRNKRNPACVQTWFCSALSCRGDHSEGNFMKMQLRVTGQNAGNIVIKLTALCNRKILREVKTSTELGNVGGTVASESAVRSAGTLLSRVRVPPSTPWPDEGPESLRSPCCGWAIRKNQTSPEHLDLKLFDVH